MADVSRLTPRPSPAHQPRTASMAPPRALADGRDGTERPDHEAHLVDRADRAATHLPSLMPHYLVLCTYAVRPGYAYPSALLWVDPLIRLYRYFFLIRPLF